MPGPSVDDLQAGLDAYKASIANEKEKRAELSAKRQAVESIKAEYDAKLAVATSELDVATTAHVASVQAVINAELENQRLNDEHTPDV